MVCQLRSRGEYGAADWFQTFWYGKRGTWTMGDAGIGHTARQWKALQKLNVRHLQHALVIGTKEHAKTWAGYMEELVTMEGPLKTPRGGTLITY